MKKMHGIKFWHQVPLDDGRVTPGMIDVKSLEDNYMFSKLDFKGKSLIDIGCWDGYFCFMAEKRGAIFQPLQEKFDIVLCYGVLYHLNDPLTAAINAFQMSRDIVIFEGLMFEDDRPILMLLDPGELGGDPSNLYTMSTAWMNKVAWLNGFELVVHQQFSHRGTMMFRAVEPKVPQFPAHCYSLPPPSAPGR